MTDPIRDDASVPHAEIDARVLAALETTRNPVKVRDACGFQLVCTVHSAMDRLHAAGSCAAPRTPANEGLRIAHDALTLTHRNQGDKRDGPLP